MRVATILGLKGSTVATIRGESTLAEAAAELRLRGVGALVVSSDGRTIEGIISERDIVRRLAERGESASGRDRDVGHDHARSGPADRMTPATI